MTARVVMEIMKSIISEEGHPTTIVNDNGPCYASEYFKQEMQKYGIQHITILPHYPQSNGFAEVYVKMCKGILQKAKDAGDDPHPVMMIYHNTQHGPNQKSPVEIICGKKAHSDLPMANAALWGKGLVKETLISAKNQHKADDNQLIEGQIVMYKTPPEKIWRKATVVKYLRHKSYNIKSEDGGIYCHTWQHQAIQTKTSCKLQGTTSLTSTATHGSKAQEICVSA